MIDYILEKTGHTQLHYAGHSQGTTVFFVLMSTKPEYNEKIKSAHMLAPVAFMGNLTSPLVRKISPTLGVLNTWSKIFGDQEFLPGNPLLQSAFNTACGASGIFGKNCSNMFFLYSGSDQPNMNLVSSELGTFNFQSIHNNNLIT